MSNSPCKSSMPYSSQRSDLMCVATPIHGEVRPRLHLTIPNQSAGNDTIKTLPTDVAQNQAHGVTGLATDAVAPQQAVQESFTSPPISPAISESQTTHTEIQSPTMRRPHVFNANATEFLHGGIPIPEEVDGFIIGPRIPYRTEGISGGGDSPRADYSSPSRQFTLASPAAHPAHQSLAGRQPHAHHIQIPSKSGQGVVANNLREAAQASHTDKSTRVIQGQYPSGPRVMGGRLHHTNPRTGGPSRLVIPNQPRGDVSHTNSRTWVNPKTRLQERWAEVYKNLKEMSLIKEYRSGSSGAPPPVGGSFCVPNTFNEWTDHRLEYANDRTKDARAKLARMEHQYLTPRHPDLPPAGPTAPMTVLPFGGKKFRDGSSAVLCMPTVWTSWTPRREQQSWPWSSDERPREERSEEERPEAMWPTEEEMREEGNERMTSGFRRFPALPRVPGNPTVNWKQKKALVQLPFDEVWKLPSAETFNAQREKTTADEMSTMEGLIGHDLLSAIDCDIGDEI